MKIESAEQELTKAVEYVEQILRQDYMESNHCESLFCIGPIRTILRSIYAPKLTKEQKEAISESIISLEKYAQELTDGKYTSPTADRLRRVFFDELNSNSTANINNDRCS